MVGTGTGIWATKFANERPEATVLGTDLSPIQLDHVPQNCSFEIDSVESTYMTCCER
jgi:methylase of polypeptide subunit release factors